MNNDVYYTIRFALCLFCLVNIINEITAVSASAIGNDHHTKLAALSLQMKIKAKRTNRTINLSKEIIKGLSDFLYAYKMP